MRPRSRRRLWAGITTSVRSGRTARDYEGGYAKALVQAGVGDPEATADAPVPEGRRANAGMHQTDTIDVVTVISGEIWAMVETGETLVRAGDTVVQRGT